MAAGHVLHTRSFFEPHADKPSKRFTFASVSATIPSASTNYCDLIDVSPKTRARDDSQAGAPQSRAPGHSNSGHVRRGFGVAASSLAGPCGGTFPSEIQQTRIGVLAEPVPTVLGFGITNSLRYAPTYHPFPCHRVDESTLRERHRGCGP